MQKLLVHAHLFVDEILLPSCTSSLDPQVYSLPHGPQDMYTCSVDIYDDVFKTESRPCRTLARSYGCVYLQACMTHNGGMHNGNMSVGHG